MNKKYSILMALVLVTAMLLAGCGSKDDSASKDSKEDAAQTTQDTGKTEDKGEDKDEAEAEIEETTLGTVEGNVYTNKYVGFGCKLDDGWVIQSAEELQDIPDNIREALKDTEMGASMDATQQIMDMQAANVETGSSVNVVYAKLGGSKMDILAARMLSEEQIIDSLLSQKDMLISTYEAAGMEIKGMEKGTVTFLGEEHTVCKTHAVLNGMDYYMVQLLKYDLDGIYGTTTTFSGTSEENIQALMDCFYVVE